jgi:hypothetical protein
MIGRSSHFSIRPAAPHLVALETDLGRVRWHSRRIISDAWRGQMEAAAEVYPKTDWQR